MARNTGRLVGIARRDQKRAPMQTLESAVISLDTGVADDFRGRPGERQVTVVSATAWRAVCVELQRDVAWTTRRANLLVDGLELPQQAGAELRIGPVRLRITGELEPCSRMDEQCPGLTESLKTDWRGGVTCSVLHGGCVSVGDDVTILVNGS
ncbi:MAG: MOSC domain-containing protein [Woeseia sp.]